MAIRQHTLEKLNTENISAARTKLISLPRSSLARVSVFIFCPPPLRGLVSDAQMKKTQKREALLPHKLRQTNPAGSSQEIFIPPGHPSLMGRKETFMALYHTHTQLGDEQRFYVLSPLQAKQNILLCFTAFLPPHFSPLCFFFLQVFSSFSSSF